MSAAERLFAERGIAAVSHRQIVLAARQGNTAAVAYHFGTKEHLVRAIEDKHGGHIEALREQMIAAIGGISRLAGLGGLSGAAADRLLGCHR